ncbi:3-oxo-tetronate kinase [Rhizobium sp. FKY42]|uniref:3-oxo-tetronate kinase n=1 Tax=Rhizobium sp. FKY42 TaxID=2562310 RepID=UPI0010BFF366|nr:3-oxo-tetronate kinase [Rhizobium sp. FKY42]
MPIRFGAIADDFTGATDLAALLSRSGWPVSLRLGLPNPDDEPVAPFEIIALKIRTIPVEKAVEKALAAAQWLEQAGAKRFYWKYCSTFDSTPKGNIGPVSEALMQRLGASQTIYCPAFPENGRSVFMGHLFVGEQPLDESPMKDHPLTPMRDSSLVRLLSPQVSSPVGLANRLVVAKGVQALRERLDTLKTEGVLHVVVDAVADDDLTVTAEATMGFRLVTGGSALAMPLPKLLADAGELSGSRGQETQVRVGEGQLVLSGSCSAMTRRQVARYLPAAKSHRLDPLALAEQGVEPALDWLRDIPIEEAKLIYATAEPDEVRHYQQALGVEKSGALVEEALARIAQEAAKLGISRFVVAGGETSGAVVNALGVRQLSIGKEIAPGVPWTFTNSGDRTIALALKSGNFGAEDFFAQALSLLEAS